MSWWCGDVFQRGLKLIPLPEEQPNLGRPRELRRFRPLELKLIILPRKTSLHCIFTIQSGAKTALCYRLSYSFLFSRQEWCVAFCFVFYYEMMGCTLIGSFVEFSSQEWSVALWSICCFWVKNYVLHTLPFILEWCVALWFICLLLFSSQEWWVILWFIHCTKSKMMRCTFLFWNDALHCGSFAQSWFKFLCPKSSLKRCIDPFLRRCFHHIEKWEHLSISKAVLLSEKHQ